MRTTLTPAAVKRMKPPESGRRFVWDSIVPGLAVRITEKGSRSWVVMTRLRGKLLLHTIGSAGDDGDSPPITLIAARQLAREALEMVARGEDPRNRRRQAQKVPGSFAAIAEEFIATSTAGAGWKAEQERILRKHVIPVLGSKRIDEITRGDVIGVLEALVDAKTPILANRTKAVVSKLFSWALDRELIEAHPCARLGSMMPKERKRERVLTDGEVRKLWKAWNAMAFPFGYFAKLLLVTAQRRGEVVSMRWSELELEAKLWRVPKTKSGHANEVPLSPLAIEILDRMPRIDGSDLVFPASNGKPFCAFSKPTKDAKKKSGIDGWRLHDLRRTAATNMAQAGIPKATIGRVLGHSELDVTSIYVRHGYLDEKRAALEQWSKKLGQIVASR